MASSGDNHFYQERGYFRKQRLKSQIKLLNSSSVNESDLSSPNKELFLAEDAQMEVWVSTQDGDNNDRKEDEE